MRVRLSISFLIAAFAILSASVRSEAQTAIETALFIMSGQEISAPEQRWSGILENSVGAKTNYQVVALDGCKYEFTNLSEKEKSAVSLDFSRITEVNLKTNNAFDISIHYNSTVSGLDGAICWSSVGKPKECFKSGTLGNLSALGLKGDIRTDRALQNAAVQMFERKKAAYSYFRSNFCKPRAF
jgi:hypothetical protein